MTQNDPNTPPPSGPAPQPVGYQNPTTTGYPGPYAGPSPDKDSMTMAMLCHLLAIFTSFIGPLIIWLVKKDTSPFVDDQGKESLNFQITVLLAWFVAGLSVCIGIGLILMPAVWVLNLVFCILATVETNKGVAYRYPFALRLIK